MNIVVFGAGGRAGRQAVAEAHRRGHRVTAVVRDPARHGDLAGARVVAGDVTDADGIAQAAAGHDAAISAAADLSAPPHDFFTASSRALATGLTKAGVRRLVVVGLASILPGASGAPLMDEPGYPNEYRSFYLGHAAGLEELRAGDLDWAYVAPAGDFDHAGARTGAYAIADHGDPASRISYADFAVALLDEVDAPRHHRAAVSIRET
ncbi:NAD(P)-dependent oxidoreductase [Actinomadura montaniterrae]|uniref:NAD(P)H-binding protein n=1 Tax=Actinomadura montaniterrae TaxID=1803903 RepID=A0A6L3VCK6_9ACTN|nr:NAD(P)H-binding protein [Actinomadura montaniterrae]KAB2358071.1 NAD(P)H-binding protein [Actinomadura montaniterrae]